MTDEQINAAIAEACGWIAHSLWHTAKDIPSYCTDLNAMHKAEKMLTEIQCKFFRTFLYEKLTDEPASRYIWHATARQRAEAFLRTLGKWEGPTTEQSSAVQEEPK
jgi:hypothetical protein